MPLLISATRGDVELGRFIADRRIIPLLPLTAAKSRGVALRVERTAGSAEKLLRRLAIERRAEEHGREFEPGRVTE